MTRIHAEFAPTHCDICECKLEYVFVDGATRDGPWAYMCMPCAMQRGIGLGLGMGQQYEWRASDRVWEKTKG